VKPPKLLSGAEFDSQLAGVDVNGWHGVSLANYRYGAFVRSCITIAG
jgi:hypothetical protein